MVDAATRGLVRLTGAWLAGTLAVARAADPTYAISLYGPEGIKYREGQPYAHANPAAPKGGTLTLAHDGAFTKLNPFSLKGTPPYRIEQLVFETLTDGSADPDEPFTEYGLLAERIVLAADRRSITYTLNPLARFSDGQPVTADDVVFSFNLIHDPEYIPALRMYYADVAAATRVDARTVTFTFKTFNQELPLICGQLPILPRHVYGVEGKAFGRDFDDLAIGSGPYVVEAFDRSQHSTYRRNPQYWGRDLAVNQGRYNFDRIVFKVFLDPIPAREALKGGLVDLDYVNSARDWALEFNGPYVQKHYLVKAAIPHCRVAGMQAFVFNLRRPLFQDIRVRKAIGAVLDFEDMNQNLFYGSYTRQLCFFDNNHEMMSRGPATGRERDWLQELRAKFNRPAEQAFPVRKEALACGPRLPGQQPDGTLLPIADRITAANLYLDQLGWRYDPRRGVRCRGDQELRFDILLYSPSWQRVANPLIERLAEIGIRAAYRLVQPAEYMDRLRTCDFDLVVSSFRQSLSPGNEQRDMWTTAAADQPGTRNVMGLRNPAVDEVVDRLIAARTRQELVTAVHVLDRLLCAEHFVISHWHIPYDRAVYWNRLCRPARYADKLLLLDNVFNWWWYDAARAARLEAAMRSGADFETAPDAADAKG